jgi:hypothetical protein
VSNILWLDEQDENFCYRDNFSKEKKHTEHCHFVSVFLQLFSLLLHRRRLSEDGSRFDRFDDEARGLLDLCCLFRSELDVRISSFFTSSISDAAVGESRFNNNGELIRAAAELFLGLLHNFSFSSLWDVSCCVSSNDNVGVCGVGLKLLKITQDFIRNDNFYTFLMSTNKS